MSQAGTGTLPQSDTVMRLDDIDVLILAELLNLVENSEWQDTRPAQTSSHSTLSMYEIVYTGFSSNSDDHPV